MNLNKTSETKSSHSVRKFCHLYSCVFMKDGMKSWRMLHPQSLLVFVEFVKYSGHSIFPFHYFRMVSLQKREVDDGCSSSQAVTTLMSQQISETLLLCSTYTIERVRILSLILSQRFVWSWEIHFVSKSVVQHLLILKKLIRVSMEEIHKSNIWLFCNLRGFFLIAFAVTSCKIVPQKFTPNP